jgi:hypothetical protein
MPALVMMPRHVGTWSDALDRDLLASHCGTADIEAAEFACRSSLAARPCACPY